MITTNFDGFFLYYTITNFNFNYQLHNRISITVHVVCLKIDIFFREFQFCFHFKVIYNLK